jgi:hypothetical protein
MILKFTPELMRLLAVVTATFPLDAPDGTTAVILLVLQFVTVAVVPLKVTDPIVPGDEPKPEPLIVTCELIGAALGCNAEMIGVTVNDGLFVVNPLTVTTIGARPKVFGTVAVIPVSLQARGVTDVPLKVIVLEPC